MKISSINRSIVSLALRSFSVVGLLSMSFCTYTMENEGGYKKMQSMQVSRAITLATDADHIAVGTALGPVKLYDSKGVLKENILYGGDGGLVFYSDNGEKKLVHANTQGKVAIHSLNSGTKEFFAINTPIYSIAQHDDKLFFGTDNDTIQVWNVGGKYIQSYTGKHLECVNALQVMDNAIIKATYGRCIAIDKETGNEKCHWDRPVLIHALTKKNNVSCYAGYRDGYVIVADEHDRNGTPYCLGGISPWNALFSLAFLKSTYLAAGHHTFIGIYDIRKLYLPAITYKLPDDKQSVIALEATEKGFTALISDGTVEVWEEVEQK